jgi:hypothetical protein
MNDMKTIVFPDGKYRIVFDPHNNDRVEEIRRGDEVLYNREDMVDRYGNFEFSLMAQLIAMAQREVTTLDVYRTDAIIRLKDC